MVERADRLARDLIEGELLLREFRSAGITVISAESGTDLSAGENGNNPSLKLIRQVLGAVAEFEKSSLVLKLRIARLKKRKETGECEGRKGYGFRTGEPEILERMRVLYRKSPGRMRRSYGEIAKALNAEGLLARGDIDRGRIPWSRQTIEGVLRVKGLIRD